MIAVPGKVLSQRGQDLLLQLHRQMAATDKALAQSCSRLIAAVQACDLVTQKHCFGDYVRAVNDHLRALRQISGFIERRFDLVIDCDPHTHSGDDAIANLE